MNSCLNALKSIVESCTYRERYCWGYLLSTSLNPSRGIWEAVTTPTQFSLVHLRSLSHFVLALCRQEWLCLRLAPKDTLSACNKEE